MIPPLDRAALLRLAAGATAVGAVPDSVRNAFAGHFPQPHPKWRFVFVNHALTNPFFVPAKNGSNDAAALLGANVEWTGSTSSDVGEMVKAMRRAIAERVHGIAVSIIDPTAFDAPTSLALKHGIPVVSYNADGGKTNTRLAYIGQDNYQSGLELGSRLVTLVDGGDVYLFIATPGQENIQPRIDGALDAIRDSGRPIRAHVVASGVDVAKERTKIEATYLAHTGLRGLFAVDAGSTAGVADVMRKHRLHERGVRAGGYDLLLADPPGHPRARARLHDRPAAVPAGLPSRAPALPRPLQQRPRRAGRHEHRPQLRHTRQRDPVSDDEKPFRGELEQGHVPGRLVGMRS